MEADRQFDAQVVFLGEAADALGDADGGQGDAALGQRKSVAVGLTTKLTFTFEKVNANGSTSPAGSVTIDTPIDSGTLLTRQDKVREAEAPADEHAEDAPNVLPN
mgnify:CR=1 FL=1